jgi:hypothetical protein
MPAGTDSTFATVGLALVVFQIVMGLSAAGMGWWLFRVARAAQQTGQWPPPGTRMLRRREPITGDRARQVKTAALVVAAVMAGAGLYMVYLAFRFARLFGVGSATR